MVEGLVESEVLLLKETMLRCWDETELGELMDGGSVL